MYDIPFAIAVIAAIAGAAVGAILVFVRMDAKVQRLRADCRRLAGRLIDAEHENNLHRRAASPQRPRPPIVRADGRLELVLNEDSEDVEWGGQS